MGKIHKGECVRNSREDFFVQQVEAILGGVTGGDCGGDAIDITEIGRRLRVAHPDAYARIVALVTRALADKNDAAMTETNISS